MNLTHSVRRFRAWQKDPSISPIIRPKKHRCANCGHLFTSNFCPACGQETTVGRITWRSVGRSILRVWGFKSRSLPYTLLLLILRPGYLINDYFLGRRQYCYPPVNLLFIIAVIYALVLRLSGIDISSYHYLAENHLPPTLRLPFLGYPVATPAEFHRGIYDLRIPRPCG